MKAERLFDLTMTLGEGPVWDEKTRALLWVDITEGRLWRHAFSTRKFVSRDLGESVGRACLTPGGREVLALKKSIVMLGEDMNTVLVDGVENDLPDSRFNDGKCDAMGRLLVGTMGQEGKAHLYILEKGKPLRALLSGVTISNGIGFSPDSTRLYYADTPTGHLWQFDYDLETGGISNRVPLIDYTREEGDFDGLCVDDEGMLWVAHWGGHQVSRWDPKTGKKIGKIEVPAPFVTSCCFYGDRMDQLAITTCRGWDEELQMAYPLSGALFVVEPGVTGPYANRFGK